MNNLVSITEASKKLGINRSRLNQLINKNNIEKIKRGRCCFVKLDEVQNLVQTLAATGHIRTPTSSNQVSKHENFLFDKYENMIKSLMDRNKELEEKNKALEAKVGELKLLSGEKKSSSVFKKIGDVLGL